MDVACRTATRDDLDAIARVRVRSWQQAYRGSVPQHYLDALDPVAEAERWRTRTLAGHHVAEADGTVVGWLLIGRYRPDDGEAMPGPDCGEVMAIYAAPETWGQGVGRALMAYALEELGRQRLHPVLLWVIEANDRARRFYEKAGFQFDGTTVDYVIAGATLPELRYRYDG